MAVQLNHTIVAARDREASARFLADILGLPAPKVLGPFLAVEADNDVTLDFMEVDGAVTTQHYAFLVSEPEFNEIFGRIRERALPYWADPSLSRPDQVGRRTGGRGVYFEDPSGHLLEIFTQAEPTAA